MLFLVSFKKWIRVSLRKSFWTNIGGKHSWSCLQGPKKYILVKYKKLKKYILVKYKNYFSYDNEFLWDYNRISHHC